jgi:Putative zinc- or iron-chelating domain
MSSSEEHCLLKQSHVLPDGSTAASRPYARALRRIRNMARYLHAFVRLIIVDPEVIWRKTDRTIFWGKIRRAIIGCIPGLALRLKRKHGLTGGCISCGASCNLLLQCPHWDEESRLCSIYDDRPITCRLFPITPSDLRERDLASSDTTCGYSFVPQLPREREIAGTRQRVIVLQQATVEHRHPR